MFPKTIRYISYILKTGIFILPILSLIIAESLFFPFITGKGFFFRIGVEILLFFWILLAVFDKSYRPKKSPILIALTALVIILSLATIFGENPHRSFWSNFERMEGLISHLHLFAYFLILTSVFKKEKDFKRFFAVLLGISAIISSYGYLQFFGKIAAHQGAKLDATFGNSTYLAIYILFHLFIIGWLFFKTSSRWFRAVLVFLFFFEIPIIYYTTTRGAILGFLAGLLIFSVLTIIRSKRKKIRLLFLGFLSALILSGVLFLVFKDSGFVQNRTTLSKLASISLSEGTVESRLTIWKMGFEGFKEHPVLGWGPENFNLVFNKYYQPNLWSKEPWFDRAHNVVFDWLATTGILGLIVYLSIFISSLFVVWRGYKRNHFSLTESSLLTGLFAAYGFHNFFVFDNIASYFLFFTILGYIHFRYLASKTLSDNKGQVVRSNGHFQQTHYLAISLSFVGVIFSLYFANLKPLLANKQLLNTLKDISQKGQDVDLILKDFDKIFTYQTFGTGEAREQLASYANNISNANVPQESKIKAIQKATEEFEKQVMSTPTDARNYIFLGSLYIKLGRFDQALITLNKALEFSPKKQQIRFVIADVYLNTSQNEKALAMLQEAYDLDQRYDEAAKNLAIVALVNNKEAYAEELLKKHFGASILVDNQLINAYARVGNYQKIKEIWQLFIEKEPNNLQYYVSLAATHIQLGERQEAIKVLEKAIELNPQFKQQGEFYINELKAGRTP